MEKINKNNFKKEKVFDEENLIKKNLKSKYSINNFSTKILMLTACLIVILTCISSVSAINFSNSTNIGSNIQDHINNPDGDDVIILESGDYTNSINNLNISRNLTIKGNDQVNIIGSGSGILFNITAKNVVISNLNIKGYQTGIKSNESGLTIKECNIETTNIAIDLSGSSLRGISIENNNISSSVSSFSYGVINVNSVADSIVSISMKGNIITATGTGDYTMAIRINVGRCDNTLIFENNTITGKSYAAVHILGDRADNKITFTNNEIKMDGKYNGFSNGVSAVYLIMSLANNTITFSKNNITGTNASGVYMDQNGCNFIILTFINNKILVEGQSRNGVYFKGMSGNNTIKFQDNTISVVAKLAIHFDIDNSKNTVTFINNDIHQKGEKIWYGLYINAGSSNNTITITHSRISGEEKGLFITTWNGNSTITVKNNNIKAVTYGFEIIISSNEYYDVNIAGNTITADTYAMYVYTLEAGNGMSFSNNTFISNDVGICFEIYQTNLYNINITGNTIIASNKGISFFEWSSGSSTIAITVNYNRILANIGLDFRSLIDSGSNFDYNWWGVNDISNKVLGFKTNNNYILYFAKLSDLSNVHVGDKVSFAILVLNTTLTNVGVENMPYFVINGNFNGIDFDTSLDELFIKEFTVLEEGLQFLEASLDNQYAETSFEGFEAEIENPDNNITNPDNNITIPDNNITKPNTSVDIGDSYNKVDENKHVDYQAKEEKEEDINKDTEDSSAVSKVNASTKSTGISIAILLILATFGLVAYRKSH